MNMYKWVNNGLGWLVFVFATAVYTLTMEPTASFWDCGEFISGAYKLQVVHPPGAPLFLMIGRLFALMAGSTDTVAYWVNFSSALSSGFTILFLFWTITALAKKLMKDEEGNVSNGDMIAIMGAGLVGALACTFTDTLWFSAVEGEVYAMSSMLTAIVFWAIMKWEESATTAYADRWIVLIAFVIGLSIGVHLLNLLTIPAITMVYYFKRYKVSLFGSIIAFFIGGFILAFIQFFLIPGLPYMAAHFDRIFVNTFHAPFWTGMIFFLLLCIGLIVGLLIWAKREGYHGLHTATLSITLLILGYSSYAMVVIRSNANPAIDMSDPSDLFSLLSYLNREQYGDTPLLTGPYFTSNVIKSKPGSPKYYKAEDKYETMGNRQDYIFDKTYFFPRIHDWRDEGHKNFYRSWLKLGKDEYPSPGDNISFFITYQMGFMYWRYFFWNFAGRQNDVQGHSNLQHGNWLSGIEFIDDTRLPAHQANAPETRDNKGFNRYYLLPFILGLLGMIWHFMRKQEDAWVVFLLFFFTGIAIILFLNQPPQQPRERDYAYAGSIYAFCIWIGLSVMALYEAMKNVRWSDMGKYGLGFGVSLFALIIMGGFARNGLGFNGMAILTTTFYLGCILMASVAIFIALGSIIKSNEIRALLALLVCIQTPFLMGAENWDDHDRSGTYTARDFANNYLNSCADHAILFTQGDNDTYPLWYAQEVEGIRTDIRIVNLSLLGVDWYINQLHHEINDAGVVKLTLQPENVRGTKRDYVPFYDDNRYDQNKFYNIKGVVKWIASEDERTKVRAQSRELIDYYPVKKLRVPVDSATVVNNGTIHPKDVDKLLPALNWDIKKSGLYKNDLTVLDIVASNDWERPIYFAISVSPSAYMNLQPFFQLEGLTYRIVPYLSEISGQPGAVNTDIMYDNIMNKFKWGGIGEGKDIYLNENNLRMTMNLRNNFARLAEELILEGDKKRAKDVLDRCIEALPNENVPFNMFMLQIIDLYYQVGEKDKAREIAQTIADLYVKDLEYYTKVENKYSNVFNRDMQQSLAVLNQLSSIARGAKDKEKETAYAELFTQWRQVYEQYMRDNAE